MTSKIQFFLFHGVTWEVNKNFFYNNEVLYIFDFFIFKELIHEIQKIEFLFYFAE